MPQKIKNLLRFFLGIPLTILSLIFISKIFFDNRDVVAKAITNIDLFTFLIGVFFFSAFFAVKSFVWIKILKRRGFDPPARSTIFAYSLSEVKRYIPGSVFAFLGRMDSHSQNVPQKETLKGIGIEAALLATSAGVMSIPALTYPIFWGHSRIQNPSLIVVLL